jgi:hypothetical protein
VLQPLQTVAMAAANGNGIQRFHQQAGALLADTGEEPNPTKAKSTELGEKLRFQMDWRRGRATARRERGSSGRS